MSVIQRTKTKSICINNNHAQPKGKIKKHHTNKQWYHNISDIWWFNTAMTVVAETSYFASAHYFDRMPMKWLCMCGYVRWLWDAQDYLSCIVLYPLQVRCHIMTGTKQQWVTVVNSWQNKSRYKCGSCSTCQESTNRCQTTWLEVAWRTIVETCSIIM